MRRRVSVGDSKTKALLECGKPTSKEKIRSKKGRHYRTDEREGDKSDKTKRTYLKEKKKPMEKWFYNCRGNDFIYLSKPLTLSVVGCGGGGPTP